MPDTPSIEHSLATRCPFLWRTLNESARQTLPAGIVAYLSGEPTEVDSGLHQLQLADQDMSQLAQIRGDKDVRAAYGRDFSGVCGVPQLAELLSEVRVCATVARLTGNIELRPRSEGNRESDFSTRIEALLLHGEVKRLADNRLIDNPKGRSIAMADVGSMKSHPQKPRAMQLRSKLSEVPKQLKSGAMGVLFLFHPGFGENRRYIAQALFGDLAWNEPDPENLSELGKHALFSEEAWRNVSACAYVDGQGDALRCREFWQNPNALISLSPAAKSLLERLGCSRKEDVP